MSQTVDEKNIYYKKYLCHNSIIFEQITIVTLTNRQKINIYETCCEKHCRIHYFYYYYSILYCFPIISYVLFKYTIFLYEYKKNIKAENFDSFLLNK